MGCGQAKIDEHDVTMPNETITEENEAEETVDVAEEEQTSNEQEATETGVVNNNHFFVMADGKVYFHIADTESLGKTALFGEYSGYECPKTNLYCYDPAIDKLETLTTDHACGRISVQGDSIYTFDSPEEEMGSDNGMSRYSLEKGAPELTIALGSYEDMIGADDKGTYLVTGYSEYSEGNELQQIKIYKDGEVQSTYDIESYPYRAKIEDDSIIYICSGEEYSIDNGETTETGTEFNLMQLDITTGEKIKLGSLPHLVLNYANSIGGIDEIMSDEDNIYFNYSSYGGTGHFYQGEGYFVKAVKGQADSISVKDVSGSTDGEGDIEPTSFAVINKEMVEAQGEPGKCEVNYEGDLGYYDEQGKWVKVASGWATELYNDDEDYKGVEISEKVGDYIYLIYNDNVHVPEEDIGWRYAYRRKAVDVYRVSVETGEAQLLLHLDA